MSSGNGQDPKRPYTRNISEKQAQQDHESLSYAKPIADQHKAKNWRRCDACLRRMRGMKVYVNGKPV